MAKRRSVLGCITARGGSKAIPKKNIKQFFNKPLIGWTIEAALASANIDRVIVNTDSEEIASVAQEFGAEVPFMRPAELASDDAQSMDVVMHCLEWFETKDDTYDYFILLQPTVPFRTTEHIDAAFSFLFEHEGESLVSFKKTEGKPQWMVFRNEDDTFTSILPIDSQSYQRQRLKQAYEYNGALYIAKWDDLKKNRSFISENTLMFEMDSFSSIDIDTPEDWEFAVWKGEQNGWK